MSEFFNLYEIGMWEAAKAKDPNRFLELVSRDAVMVCGGYRCLGEEYAEYIKDYDLKQYSVLACEMVLDTDSIKQLHYVIKTEVNEEKNKDLAGIFHVTSTWKNTEGKWMLIFNMDSLIME